MKDEPPAKLVPCPQVWPRQGAAGPRWRAHGPGGAGQAGGSQGSVRGLSSCGLRCMGCPAVPPQVPGRYTVTRLDEKGVSDVLALRSGDEVELVQEGDEGLW